MPLLEAKSQPMDGALSPLVALRAVAEKFTYDYVLLHSAPDGQSLLAFDPIATLSGEASFAL